MELFISVLFVFIVFILGWQIGAIILWWRINRWAERREAEFRVTQKELEGQIEVLKGSFVHLSVSNQERWTQYLMLVQNIDSVLSAFEGHFGYETPLGKAIAKCAMSFEPIEHGRVMAALAELYEEVQRERPK